ncbi:MAG: hypothetical protein OEZ39_04445 [Gammaproteobacteria bacterium]|nr:hypothetical protein [Gammaproteobacteria bacterium]MDH5651108.1 hypothetical protein [Gammaproteobacteria bacterium]
MNSKKGPFTLEEIRKMKGETNIEAFTKMTDKDIKAQILADPDTPNLSDYELKEFDFPRMRENKA